MPPKFASHPYRSPAQRVQDDEDWRARAFADAPWRRRPHVQVPELRELLITTDGVGRGVEAPAGSIDVRRLWCNSGLAKYRAGTHADFIHGLAFHDEFLNRLGLAKRMLREGMSQIDVRCSQGRHRSVAFAILLKAVLDVEVGDQYQVTIEHRAEESWPCGSWCMCRRTTMKKEQAIARAIELWQSI